MSLAVGACASATLTLTALALAYYFDHPGTSWSVAVVWSFRAGIWWPLILTNLPFDLATIAVTTGVLTAIARPRTGGLVIKTTFNLTVLLFDFVIALVLAIAVSPTALWILNKFSVFGFKGWIQELEDVIAGLLWLLGFQASEGLLINFLYSSTTLLPTLLVVAILAFATLAKLIADTGVGASAYLLGASTEYDREPESLPAATMLGALLAVVLSVWVAIDHMLFNSGVG
ncbi:MAG: hypothetical protein V3S55_14790 [Nitrospiraceae bacterium]